MPKQKATVKKNNKYSGPVCPECPERGPFKSEQAFKFHMMGHAAKETRKQAKMLKKDFFEMAPEDPKKQEVKPMPATREPPIQQPAPKADEEIYCECGADIRPGQRICSACGQELDWS